MSEKVHILSGKSVGIFHGDNIIVDDEFQPDEGKLDSDGPSELQSDYDADKLDNSDDSQDKPLIYEAEVLVPNENENNQFWFANTDSTSVTDQNSGTVFLLDDQSKSGNMIIEQSLTISNFEFDSVQHSKVIHIDTKPDLTKPSVSGLTVARGSVIPVAPAVKKATMQPIFLCPEKSCKLKLPSKSSLLTHVKMCHREILEDKTDMEADDPDGFLSDENTQPDGGGAITEESDFEKTDSEDINEEKKLVKGKSPKMAIHRKLKIFECQYCGFVTDCSAAKLRKHVKEVHEEIKQYHCTECGIKVSRKYHLIRHIKAVHHKEKFWQCEDCDYKTNNQVCFKKHKQNKHEGGGDCDILYSVDSLQNLPKGLTEADLKCVCTWCVFKSNKYSVVKKHIEIHHERKKHYPCKECVFVGQSVDDYAEHYHTFHKTDSYPHACTDCSFKCTNKHDLKQHYSDTHSKQRLYVCKMCDHKSNDVNNMKRHINTVHSNSRKVYRCENCNYETDQRMEILSHRYNIHGLSMTGVSDDMKIILFNSQNVEGNN